MPFIGGSAGRFPQTRVFNQWSMHTIYKGADNFGENQNWCFVLELKDFQLFNWTDA